jgi:uncharacterized protein (TIGR03545 family)
MTDVKNTAPKKVKSPKVKGPLRLEAIVPIAIVFIGIWAYTVFLLDGHVRRAMEFGASRIYGAQVDIGSVSLNFRDPSFTVSGIEITDKAAPSQNALSVAKIRFALLWDALLRAKFVVEESSITGIALNSPRKTPGVVFPPPPPEPSKGPSLTEKVTEELKAEAEAQLKNNVFGDLAKILSGTDATEQLKQMKDQLQSEAKIKELQTSLESKKAEWTKRINDLPKPDEVKALIEKVKGTKINTSNPVEAKAQIEALRKDVEKVQAIVATCEKGQKDIEQDISGFNVSLKQIEDAARKDMDSLQSKFQLPNIDKESLTKALLAKVMGDKMLKLVGFMDKAKAYLPDRSKKTAETNPEYIPHPRSKGRTYKFPVTVGYPLFWLKKAEISSQSTPEGFSGDFSGQLLHLTTDAALINKPTTLDLAGSAPKQEIKDIGLKVVMDYRGDEGATSLDLAVGSHPFPEQSFANSDDITFAISPSIAALKAHADFQGGEIKSNISEVIQNPSFKTNAKAPLLKEALASITSRIKTLNMNVALSGSFTNPKFGLDSNLGTELATGLQLHLKAKIDEAKAKLKSFVEDRISGERTKLMGEYTKLQGSFGDVMKGKDAELKNLQTELNKAVKEKGNTETSKVKEDLKNKAKDAFKKFGL